MALYLVLSALLAKAFLALLFQEIVSSPFGVQLALEPPPASTEDISTFTPGPMVEEMAMRLM